MALPSIVYPLSVAASVILCGLFWLSASRRLRKAGEVKDLADLYMSSARHLNMLSANRCNSSASGQATAGVVAAIVDAAGGRVEIAPDDFVNAINRQLDWRSDPATGALVVTTTKAI